MNSKKGLLVLLLSVSMMFSCGRGAETSSSAASKTDSSSADSSLTESSKSSEASSAQSSSSTSEKTSSSGASSESSSTESISEESSTPDSSSSQADEGPWEILDVYDGYYENIHWSNGEDLREKLYTVMHKNYTALPYDDPNWETNQCADQALDDFESVDVVYSADNNLKTDTNYGGIGWQREHAFPACLMTGSLTSKAVKNLGRATDFHNLFASFYSGNTSRGSKNYGVASTSSSSYTSKLTNNGQDGYSFDDKNFEPSAKDKGRLSRAIFYMATMYMYDEQDTKNNVLMKGLNVQEDYVDFSSSSAYETYAVGNLSTLIQWSDSVSVDRLEYQHNESVHSHLYNGVAQGNRNAYVDFPELVDYVFGSKKNQAGKLSDLVSSYSKLSIGEDAYANYAIQTAPREYKVGDTWGQYSPTLVKVKNDFTYESSDIVCAQVVEKTFDQTDAKNGSVALTVKTPINDITYNVKVTEGLMDSCNYQYTLAKDDVTANIAGYKAATTFSDTDCTFNSVDWTIHSATAVKVTNNAQNGLQFGTSTVAPGTLTFATKEDWNYENKTNVNKVYVKANTASGCTYKMTVSVGDYTSDSISVSYNTGEPKVYGVEVPNAQGKLTISFTNVTKAVYVQAIAINSIA